MKFASRLSNFLRAPLLLLIVLPFSLQAQLNSWIQQNSGTSVWLHGVKFVNASTGWAVGDGGTIIKSTNTGVSWTPQSSGRTITLTGTDFLDATHGLACGGKGFAGAILRTTNGGANWTAVDSSTNLSSIDYVTSSLAWAVGAGGILKSTNGGSTWSRQPMPDSSTVYNSISFFDAGTGWLTGLSPAAGVIYKTTDGGSTWVMETNGIHSYDYIDGLFFFDSQHGWMSGYTVPDTIGYGMIKRTTDGGANWIDAPLATDQELYSIAFASVSSGWACGSSGIILHSTDAGQNWVDDGSVTNSLDKVTVLPGQGGWIVGLDGTVLRNNFGGLSQEISVSMNTGWNMLCLPLDVSDRRKTTLFPTAASNAFRYSPAQGYLNDDTLDVGTGYWVKFSNAQNITYDGSAVDSITLNLVAGWNLVGGVSADVPVSHLLQNPPNSITNIYRYTPTGYQSDTVIQAGQAYWMKAVQSATLTIQSALHGNAPLNMLTKVSEIRNDELPPPPPGSTGQEAALDSQTIPAEYGLGQNYPNPFNPSTAIRYDLPEPSIVRLVVYDAVGRQVATLVDGRQDAGSRTVQWNMDNQSGKSLATGIYFYRLDVHSQISERSFSDVRKMLLIK